MENQLKTRSLWIEEDLNSIEKFNIDFIYKIHAGGSSFITSYLNTDNLTFIHNSGAACTTSNTDRKKNSGLGAVTKMMKQKC